MVIGLVFALFLVVNVGVAQEALVKSVILMIGDGMGPNQVKLAELFKGETLGRLLRHTE